MNGEPIVAVNAGLQALLTSLRSNPYALESVHLSITTFDSEIKEVLPMTPVADIMLPEITCPKSGATLLGAALEDICAQVQRDVRKSSATEKGDWKPMLVILTDGKPTDTMAYSEKVVDHFNNPRNMGSFKKEEDGVGTGIVGAPECGDVMKLQIKVQNDTIVDAKFKTFGCGSAIASSSLATEWLKGKTVEEAGKIKNTDIVQELNLPPVKIHCSVLAEDAIKAALADYQKKADSK